LPIRRDPAVPYIPAFQAISTPSTAQHRSSAVPRRDALEADGGGTGLWLTAGDEPAGAVVEMTAKVREIAMEALWQACPHRTNGHPLDPDVADGVVVSVCGGNGRVVARVGELPGG
jgi:hypothetical protein